jgi:hypothetical protein
MLSNTVSNTDRQDLNLRHVLTAVIITQYSADISVLPKTQLTGEGDLQRTPSARMRAVTLRLSRTAPHSPVLPAPDKF